MAYRNIEGGRSPSTSQNVSGSFLNREPVIPEVQRDTFDEDMRLYKTLMVRALIRKYGEVSENVLQDIEENIDNTIQYAKDLIIDSRRNRTEEGRREENDRRREENDQRNTERREENGQRNTERREENGQRNTERREENHQRREENGQRNIIQEEPIQEEEDEQEYIRTIENIVSLIESEPRDEKRRRTARLNTYNYITDPIRLFVADLKYEINNFRRLNFDETLLRRVLMAKWAVLPEDVKIYYRNISTNINDRRRTRTRDREEENENTEEEEFNREEIGRYINIVRQILNERQNETEQQKRDREERLLTDLHAGFFTLNQWTVFLKDIQYELFNRIGRRISREDILIIWNNLPNEIKNYYNNMTNQLNRSRRRR
jgi:hypothetical protein